MSNFTDSAGTKSINQREHNTDAASKRVVIRAQDPDTGDWANIAAQDNGDGTSSISTKEPDLATRVDDTTTANVTYIGKAEIGSATSSAVWQIQRLDESTGLVKTWADGNASFDNVYDDRASLDYQ